MNIGIVGYGDLGQAIERRTSAFPDMTLECIVSRRASEIKSKLGSRVITPEAAFTEEVNVDCMIIAVGSENDATDMVSAFASRFNTVDCFDMHRYGTKHRKIAENAAKNSNHVSVSMSGWDPGLLSVVRLYLSAFIPECAPKTFWGKGVSRGHTNALKSIRGVIDAVQYTVPLPEAKAAAFRNHKYSGASHKRVCFIACESGAEKGIERKIRDNEYFAGCPVEINFMRPSELSSYKSLYHSGDVIAGAPSPSVAGILARFTVNMQSNSDFTANILLASARAAYRLYNEGQCGAFTILDIPPNYLYIGDPYSLL